MKNIHLLDLKKGISLLQIVLLVLLFSACSKDRPNQPDVLSVTYTLNSPGFYPENFDYDNTGHKFIIGSFNKGVVYSFAFAQLSPFITDQNFVSVTGIYTDEVRNRVIVLSGDIGSSEKSKPNGASAGSVAYAGIYNLITGVLIKGVNLKPLNINPAALPNDIAVDDSGNIFITDSFSPVIYKIDINYSASIYATDNRFVPSPGAFGLNGIVIRDGYMLVTKTDEGKLFKISTSDPKDITQVTGFSIPAADGLEWTKDGKLVVIENGLGEGNAYEFTGTNNWSTVAQDAKVSIGKIPFPTAATLAPDGNIYVLATTKLGLFLSGDKTESNFIIKKVSF